MTRIIVLLTVTLTLAGCDGIMRIRGVAPDSSACVLKLVEDDTGQVKNIIPVSGTFEETIFFAGHWRAPELDVVTECGGKIISTVRNPEFPEVNLGNIKP